MPQFNNAVTKSSEVIWQKGDRTIWKVGIEIDGKVLEAKTYSRAISQVGFSGDLETYEKEGRPGYPPETFVKQPQKEGGYSGGGKSYGKAQADPFTMYLSYAKDLVVSLQETSGYDRAKFDILLKATIEGGNALYKARPDANPTETPNTEPVVTASDLGGERVSMEDVPFSDDVLESLDV